MNVGDKHTKELAGLADRIEQFDRAHRQPKATKPIEARPVRPTISSRERAIRRWVLGAMIVWGALIYALILLRGWGNASGWELVLAGPIVIICVAGCYGFHVFYAELGKEISRKLSGKKTIERQ